MLEEFGLVQVLKLAGESLKILSKMLKSSSQNFSLIFLETGTIFSVELG